MDTANWLRPQEMARLRELGSRRRLPAGSFLFLEGDDPAAVIVVDSGTIKVSTTSSDGREIVLAIAEADEVLGEMSAMDEAPRSASAVAMTAIELTEVPSHVFRTFLQDSPRAGFALAKLLAERLRQANRRQLEYASADALGRLCARLDELRERQSIAIEPGAVIELPMNQTDLAQWAGLSREAVVKGLRTLRTLGWIETARSTVTLHEPAQVHERGLL